MIYFALLIPDNDGALHWHKLPGFLDISTNGYMPIGGISALYMAHIIVNLKTGIMTKNRNGGCGRIDDQLLGQLRGMNETDPHDPYLAKHYTCFARYQHFNKRVIMPKDESFVDKIKL